MITSLANGRMKELVLLQEKSRARNKEGIFLAEGIKMFEEAPLERLKEVYCAEKLWRRMKEEGEHGALWRKLQSCRDRGIFVEQVSDEVFRRVSDTQTPQGIMFVMKQFSHSLEEMLQNGMERRERQGRQPLFLLLEDIQDPGNLGTMLRTAEGAGATGVIMSKGTADIYNPKVIRSTMGSLYRLPFCYEEDLGKAVKELQQKGISVYAAHLQGERFYDEISYEGGSAFLIGNEGKGLKKETAELADSYLKIPMEGSLESLNAAVAAALLMYQAAGYNRRKEK